MRKTLSAAALVLLISLTVMAGDVQMPPKAPPPPPCSENCGNSATAASTTLFTVIQTVLALIRP